MAQRTEWSLHNIFIYGTMNRVDHSVLCPIQSDITYSYMGQRTSGPYITYSEYVKNRVVLNSYMGTRVVLT